MNFKHFTLVLALAAPVACAHGAKELVRSSTKGGIAGGLEAMNDPANQALLRRLLGDPAIQKAAHDLTAALTGGAIDGLTDEQRGVRVREASDAYIRTIAAAVGHALDEDISPALTRSVNDLVGGAVSSAISPGNRRLAEQLVDGVARTAITAFTQSTASGLRDDLGPALTELLAEDLGPALQKVIEQNLGPALRKVIEEDLTATLRDALSGEEGGPAGTFARSLTKQIVLGVNDGMSELGISPSPNGKDGVGIAQWLLILFGALLLILTVVLVRLFLTRRAIARDRARSEEMLVNILQAIKTSEAEAPEAPANLDAVLARVQQHMPNRDNDTSYLAAIVGRAVLPRAKPPRV